MTSALAKQSAAGLSKYNPERGLKNVAMFEAAEKYYARAKDATKLEQAIRAKRETLAEFVFWWDTKGPGAKSQGQRTDLQLRGRSVAKFPEAGKDGLPDTKVVSRWRAKLNDPQSFEKYCAEAVARCVRIVDFETTAHVGHNSGENEWYTPAEFVEAARTVLGSIDLDPASTDAANVVVKAEQIYTASDDALAQQWDGRVWMNPPYSQPLITQFCEKLAASVKACTVPAFVVLVNNATETQWFRSLADVSASICFPTGRVQFWSPGKASATPLQGQAVLYAGRAVDRFAETFALFGFVAEIRR